MSKSVITRFPPSPTGALHMGSARTALFNYLYAQSKGGKMVLRMEDTDKERSKKEFEEDIVAGLNWLGIKWDGEILRQSERTNIYKEYLGKLIESGNAYEAEENQQKTGKVVRFKNPNKKLKFTDTLRGEIEVDTTELGDFVIARSLDDPLYHLTVVVDDALSNVTHIIRGEDGLSNTPRQILIMEALGFTRPEYTHIPFILGADKTKLSKRHGATSVLEYKEKGYLPEAALNFLAMLGWRSKKDDEKELWSMQELIDEFDIDGFQKSPAVFNEEKLRWINKEYLKNVSDEEFWENVLQFADHNLKAKLERDNVKNALLQDIKERISVYSDIKDMEEQGEFNWLLNENIEIKPDKLIWKKSDKEETLKHLEFLLKLLQSASGVKEAQSAIEKYAEEQGKGNVLWPLRYALSGADKSPSPYALMQALGLNLTVERIQKAASVL